ncbi:hypothetical protein J7K55_01565, partial [Candidatus Aerophobetes bacterium]|nr:hypothetical protein [Candidatus Aerophobetes bacterium]
MKMSKVRINTDKLQVTFVPETKDNQGKMFFWLPPRYEEFSIEKVLRELIKSLSDSDSHFHIKGFRERYIPQLLNRWLKPVTVSHQWEDY